MRIIDIPECKNREDLLIIDQNSLVLDAVNKMKDKHYGSCIVTNNGKLSGIFTERDLLVKVVAENLDLSNLKLIDVMTKNVQTAYFEDEVYKSIERMLNGSFRHLPIIDADNNLIGMVSQRDFIAISWNQLLAQLTNKTKASFLSFSSVWMLFLGIILYSVLIFFFFNWFTK